MVDKLVQGKILLGNASQILKQVRHWPAILSFCREEGILFPETRFAGDPPPPGGCWLIKPNRSGGGHGISFWHGNPPGRNRILQEYIEGIPASAAFVADGRDCVLLGVTEQLIEERFKWAGNILPLKLPSKQTDSFLHTVEYIASRLTRAFHLRGVNGFDFQLIGEGRRLKPCLIEVNPRYTASMELMEQAYGLNIFDLHVRSFWGELPSFSLRERIHKTGFFGKRIVYADSTAMMPETSGWRAGGRKDVPFPGERIKPGHPVCTVFARAGSRQECQERLREEDRSVMKEISGLKEDRKSAGRQIKNQRGGIYARNGTY
ncbi:hypothetical protein ES703_18033 [subsurface metagenome]